MELIIIGNVQTILKGIVTKNELHRISLDKLPYALGEAVVPNQNEILLGESIVYENIGHVFTTKKTLLENNSLDAAFLMGIRQKPKENLKIEKKQLIRDLYYELNRNYVSGFVIVGKAFFSKLNVAYLKLSPIYHEEINVLYDKYWQREEFKNCEAQLFGVVTPKPDPRAFYHNPNDKGNQILSSHTHVLISTARHLLTDSEFISGNFWIEEID